MIYRPLVYNTIMKWKETVTFVDGFGRPVQVKKDGVVTTTAKSSAPKDETVMIVAEEECMTYSNM